MVKPPTVKSAKRYLAHVREQEDGSFEIHDLEEHLRAVAKGDEVLKTLMDLDLQVERHSETVLRKTNAVAWAYNLTWYDAVYVALAEILGFPCVTADEALLRKMKGHSIVIHLKDVAFE